eukprot:SAG11_NODE_1471_length_4843_cov_1.729132_2_plen_58_part_00
MEEGLHRGFTTSLYVVRGTVFTSYVGRLSSHEILELDNPFQVYLAAVARLFAIESFR